MNQPINPLPAPVGPVHYSAPRAVMVRDPESTGGIHSAVESPLIIYTDTVTQAQAIINGWQDIMAAAANVAQEILRSVEGNVDNA